MPVETCRWRRGKASDCRWVLGLEEAKWLQTSVSSWVFTKSSDFGPGITFDRGQRLARLRGTLLWGGTPCVLGEEM